MVAVIRSQSLAVLLLVLRPDLLLRQLPEWRVVGHVHGHAEWLELLLRLGERIDALGVLAHDGLGLARAIEHQLLLVGRERVPHAEVHRHQGRAVVVAGHRVVFGNLVGLQRNHVDDGQIGAIDHALLRGGDHLGPAERHRDRADAVHRVGEHLRWLGADLQSAQVARFIDRSARIPEVTETVVEVIQHLDAVFLLEGLVELIADLAVQDLVGLVIGTDQIADQEHAHLGEDRRGGAGRRADGDAAGLHAVHHVDFLGQQRAAVEFNLQFASRALGHRLGEPVECDRAGFRHRRDMGDDQLGGLGLCDGGRLAERQDAGETARTVQDTAAAATMARGTRVIAAVI